MHWIVRERSCDKEVPGHRERPGAEAELLEAGGDGTKQADHGHDQHEQKLTLSGLTIPTNLVTEVPEGDVELGPKIALQSLKLKGHIGARRHIGPTHRRKMLHQRRRLLRTQRRFQPDIEIMTTLLGNSHNKNLESTNRTQPGPTKTEAPHQSAADVTTNLPSHPDRTLGEPPAPPAKHRRLPHATVDAGSGRRPTPGPVPLNDQQSWTVCDHVEPMVSEAGGDRTQKADQGDDQHEQKLTLSDLAIPPHLVTELRRRPKHLVAELTK